MDGQLFSEGYNARLREIIDTHGWAVQGVLPEADQPGVPFGYTVGLTAKDLPELVIYGLPPRTASAILNTAARRMTESGPFSPGDRISPPSDGPDVAVIDVVDTDVLTMIEHFYGPSRALQLVWPDEQGRFPWQNGYDIPADAQPLAGPAPTSH